MIEIVYGIFEINIKNQSDIFISPTLLPRKQTSLHISTSKANIINTSER